MASILDLFAHIGLKADQAPAERFLRTIKGMKTELVTAVAGTLSFSAAIKAVNGAMQNAMQLKNFAAQTGASTTQLQRWKMVADQVSGSGAAVAESVKAIVANQNKIKLGQGNISGYQLLGIDPRSNPFEVMRQIADKTRNLSAGMRKNIMEQFGVSGQLAATLELSNKQFNTMAKRAYVISPAMINGMNKARGTIERLKNAVTYFAAELATKLGPVIDRVTQFLIKFVQFIIRGVENIDKLVRNTIGWRAALIAVLAVLAAMNASFLVSPIGMFTAAILLLMTILEDFAAYSAGRKSLIGYIMEKFPALSGPLKTFMELLTGIGMILKSVFSGNASGFNETIKKWQEWGGILKMIADLLDRIRGFFASQAGKQITGGLGEAATQALKGNLVSNSSTAPSAGNGIFKFGEGLLRAIGANKLANQIQKNWDHGSTTININATDSMEGAKHAAHYLQRTLNHTQAQNASPKREASGGNPYTAIPVP